MIHRRYRTAKLGCPGCDIGPFTRNHYFTGKLLVERDFNDEQRYYIDKLRHHHQRLHGWGVVCGLKVKQHENPACRDRYVCIEPGTAIDCCGHEILVREQECIDITQLESMKVLQKENPPKPHTLQICIRYKECGTEEIPVLYDECGCDDTQCAPNRILESYEVDVIVNPKEKVEDVRVPQFKECCDLLWSQLDGCPECDIANCVVLATIDNYKLGFSMEDKVDPANPSADLENKKSRIDNHKGRELLPSTETIKEMLECFCETGLGGAGTPGPQGPPGPPGPGLEEGLTRIIALSWKHGESQILNSAIIPIMDTGGNEIHRRGIVIGFGKELGLSSEVDVQKINPDHVFQILVPPARALMEEGFLDQFRPISGVIVPVNWHPDADSKHIISATEVSGPTAIGVAFVIGYTRESGDKYRENTKIAKVLLEGRINKLLIYLHGDFVLDDPHPDKARAIDAEFVRGQLPTGDRPSKSGFGIQGGLFESWFTIARDKILINKATAREIADALPLIGDVLAKRIVAARRKKKIENLSDLLKIEGITESTIEGIKDLIDFD